MSKMLFCETCGQVRDMQEGTRRVYEGHDASDEGPAEPDEYERVVWGKAKLPNPDERFMLVNEVPIPMPTQFYICDLCSAAVNPGERCVAWSLWRADMIEPLPWEDEYLERAP